VDLTRQRLIEAAARVFTEKGYDRAGVQEIARRAGLTTGAIYGQFRGKAELLQAAIEWCATDELDELFASSTMEVPDIISTAGSHLVTPSQAEESEWALLLEAFVAARRDRDVQEKLQRHVSERAEVFARAVDSAKADGTIDPRLDTESIVTFAHAVGLGFVLLDAVAHPLPDPAPWEQLITRLVAALAPATDPKGE
jgi:AcrR family transcriptional regulator